MEVAFGYHKWGNKISIKKNACNKKATENRRYRIEYIREEIIFHLSTHRGP